MMNRRAFVTVMGTALVAAPLVAEAQQKVPQYRVGFLEEISGRKVPWIAAFEQRLRDVGYVEGNNLVLDFKTAGGHVDHIRNLAAELIRLKPDVIVSLGGPDGPRVLKQTAGTIPTVFAAIEWDPIAAGVVASLVRPGGNLTGV